MVETVGPERYPGDPVRVAAAIYEVVNSDQQRHWVLLGSDAYRLVGQKLDRLRAEIETGKEMTFSTDFPNFTASPVL